MRLHVIRRVISNTTISSVIIGRGRKGVLRKRLRSAKTYEVRNGSCMFEDPN